MTARSKWSLALLVGIAIIATGVVAWHYALRFSSPPLSGPSTNLKINRSSEGGFSGRGDSNDFTIDGTTFHSAATTITLKPDQIQVLRAKIKQVNFFALAPRYFAPECADAFRITLSISMDDQSKTVTYDECNQKDLPPQLPALDRQLIDLSYQKQ